MPGALLLTFSSLATAITFQTTPTEKLLEKSDVVAYVEIRSGEIIEVDGKSCGARYKAKVLDVIKGQVSKNQLIEFGPGLRREIGAKYVVFLTTGTKRVSAISSFTSSAMRPEQEFEQRCASVFPANYETIEGNGTLAVLRNSHTNFNAEVFFDEMLITPPPAAQKRAVDPQVFKTFGPGDSLVPLDSLLQTLHDLAPGPQP
jgi:hypothetical protein